jgi:hypothetical protein
MMSPSWVVLAATVTTHKRRAELPLGALDTRLIVGQSAPMPLRTVELRSEQGEVLDRVFDEGAIARLKESIDDERSVCLRFIDPYGDTVFNPAQAAVLSAELNAAMGPVVDREDHARLVAVTGIADRCAASLHVLLWFIGD